MRITKLFFHGAPKEAAFTQLAHVNLIEAERSDYQMSFFLNKKSDQKNDLIEALKSLPEGAYVSSFSSGKDHLGHAMWMLKKRNVAYIFDPNNGLIKIEGPNLEEKILEKLLLIQTSNGLSAPIYFCFNLCKGKAKSDLWFAASNPVYEEFIQEIKPGIFTFKKYVFNSYNIFSGIIFWPINKIIQAFLIMHYYLWPKNLKSMKFFLKEWQIGN